VSDILSGRGKKNLGIPCFFHIWRALVKWRTSHGRGGAQQQAQDLSLGGSPCGCPSLCKPRTPVINVVGAQVLAGFGLDLYQCEAYSQ
jgi:hypothetical protein